MWESLMVRVQNAISGLMVPVTTAGVTAAVLFFMLIAGINPLVVNAAANTDGPTIDLYVGPKLKYSPFPAEIGHHGDQAIVVETIVGANGRVQDFRIISDNDSQELRREVERSLIFTHFEPAREFGRPVTSRVVISFGNVDVSDEM
jgi:hypothetical protein